MDKSGACLVLSALLAAAGCASQPRSPSPSQVKVTTNPADVAGCRAIGTQGLPDQPLAGEIIRELQTAAAGTGGNVVFVDTNKPPYHGETYICDPGSLPRRGG